MSPKTQKALWQSLRQDRPGVEHRGMRSENTASLVRKQAASIGPHVVRAIGKIHGTALKEDADAVHSGVMSWLSKYPLRAATRRQAALHEAGHLIAFEAEGMVAFYATIRGSSFGRAGWGGVANCQQPPAIGPDCFDPDELLREARATLAGAWAEAVLGDGDVFSSPSELCEAHLLAVRTAKLSARDEVQVWRETLLRTAAIVEQCASEIEEIAEMLSRRRRVTRYESSTRRVLERVQRTPIAVASVSTRSKELVSLIEAAVPSLKYILLEAR